MMPTGNNNIRKVTKIRPLIVTIDPGMKGAMAVRDEKNMTFWEFDRYTETEIIDEIEHLPRKNTIVLIEDVYSSLAGREGKIGLATIKSLCRQTGVWEGAMLALGIKYTLVRPQVWQEPLGLIRKKDEKPHQKKRRHRDLVQKLYPGLGFDYATGTDRLMGSWDTIADAILMSEYAVKHILKA